MVAAAADKRGLKRICLSCSTRFYDFNKRPIMCPNCSTEFTGDVKIRTRRLRPVNDEDGVIDKPILDETAIVKDDDVAPETEAETVSLDEVEEDDDADEAEEETLDADLDLDEEDLDDDDDDDEDDEDDDDDEDDEEDEK
jgi:uncharacterized protein (TIGR02300 family)